MGPDRPDPDSIISGFLSFLLSKVTSLSQSVDAAAHGSTKMMVWLMPVMCLYIGFIVPAALGVYWVSQSVFSIVQEVILGRFYTKKLEAERLPGLRPSRRTGRSG